MSDFHVYRFDGWDDEDVSWAKEPESVQIRRVSQALFHTVWSAFDPRTCLLEASFGRYTFTEDRAPVLMPRRSFCEKPDDLLALEGQVRNQHRHNGQPLICGFLKARNEIVREGNIYRVIANLRRFCDVIVACDDASTDGTADFLRKNVDVLIETPPDQQDFRKELLVKQAMLEMVHPLKPLWIWWADADEELSDAGCKNIRAFCESQLLGPSDAFRFHYTQLWRNRDWARTDHEFDDGWFIKLWRWSSDLYFEHTYGTHGLQVPRPILDRNMIEKAPWEVIHHGNYGKNLIWKCIQYANGLGGVERHRDFDYGIYRPVSPEAKLGLVYTPTPFSGTDKLKIGEMDNLESVQRTFAVIVPTYNRASYLPEALASLVNQTYRKWIAIVLDDGSTDDTPHVMRRWQDLDPRIFYCRYPEHRGAVAMNEIGMAMACQMTEWWTRLGSDDYFEKHKLMLDAQTLVKHEVCYGPYRVLRDDSLAEMCNHPMSEDEIRHHLSTGNFHASWANIAARCSALKKIRTKFGNFCDPQLVTMEDFLVNARLANVSEIVWRGQRTDGSVRVGLTPDYPKDFVHDAVWRVNPAGSTSNATFTNTEHVLTCKLIRKMERTEPSLSPDYIKKFWERASMFPTDKEVFYPDHAKASGFDELHGLKILEYGCGGGSDTLSLLRRGNEVTYADIVTLNINNTVTRILEAGFGKQSMPYLLHKSESLQALNDSSYDVVYSHGVLHHIEDPMPILREFLRVLRPGGRLIVMLYTEELFKHHADQCKRLADSGLTPTQAFGACTDGAGCPYATFYRDADGRKLIESAGFPVDKTVNYNSGYFRVFHARKP